MKRFTVLIALGSTAAVLLLVFVQAAIFEETKPTPSRVTREKRKANILSFDGGGSKGIMEVAILDDVMRLVTILKRDPTSLEYLTENEFLILDQNKRNVLVAQISKVRDPIHPTNIFDMIVGTSTGGLIAFGLVGVNTDNNGKRLPMSLGECIEMYLNNTRKIFEKSWSQYIFNTLFKIPLIPYSPDNLKKVLTDQFGDSILADFRDSKNVAAVVARKIGQKEELVLFDTKSSGQKLHKIKQVLLATANAPVYFETPVKIGREEYVDGGVGGNCPLAQAIPRAQEIFGEVNSVLSVAPPSSRLEKQIPPWFQLKYWLTYFVHQVTDGHAVYKDVQRQHKSISFRRLTPRGKGLNDFELDEDNAQHMLDAIEEEKLTNDLFLVDVIAMATYVLNASVSKEGDSTAEKTAEVGAKLAMLAGRIYAAEPDYGLATDSFDVSLHLWRKISGDRVKKSIAETEGYFSENLLHQGRYREAREHANLSLINWRELYNDEDHVNVSIALFTYGKSLHSSGEYKEGYKNYELALEMQKRIYGQNAKNAYIATILHHMGWVYREHGELKKAKIHLKHALDIRMQLYGGECHIDVARALDGLGLLSTTQGNFDEGEKYLQRSLKIKMRWFGDKNHPAVAASYNNLGWCLIRQQRHEDAQVYLKRALQMKQALFGEDDHKSIALTLENLARSFVYQGKVDLALEHAQQALVMKIKCLGDIVSPAIAKTLHTIGLCFVKKKNFLEAYEYTAKAIKIIEVVFESKVHPMLSILFTTLGDSLVGMGNDSEAKGHFKNALKLIDDQFGGEHLPDGPDILRKLMDVSRRLGHKDDEVTYRRRLERIEGQTAKVFSYRRFGTRRLVDEEICPQTKSTSFLGFESSDADLPPNRNEPSQPARTEL